MLANNFSREAAKASCEAAAYFFAKAWIAFADRARIFKSI